MESSRLLLPGARQPSRVTDNQLNRSVSSSFDETALGTLLRASSYCSPEDSAVDISGSGSDHNSLFSVESDILEAEAFPLHFGNMAANGPYYDNASQLDLPGMDMGLNSYDHNLHHNSRYPEPSYQTSQPLNLHHTADLHNLVAAAHSVAEQEQNLHRTAPLQTFTAPDQAPKRRKGEGNRKTRTKRRKLALLEQENESEHGDGSPQSRSTRMSAALYRTAPIQSKHWTRPPMKTLYNSFNIAAERFLQLQSDAKDFMLDPEHPDRRNLVGVRGRSDAKNVKLELVRSVEEFLDGGIGEKYFEAQNKDNDNDKDDGSAPAEKAVNVTTGRTIENTPENPNDNVDSEESKTTEETAPDPGINPASRFYEWPRDRTLLVGLCVPLLRRVATNERQRQYAESTRRAVRQSATNDISEQTLVNVQVYFLSTNDRGNSIVTAQTRGQVPAQKDAVDEEGKTQWDRVCTLLGLEALSKSIRAQTPNGMVDILDESAFAAAVDEVLRAPWLDRVVRLVVRAEEGEVPESVDTGPIDIDD